MTNPETLHDFYHRYIAASNARDYDAVADMIHDDVLVGGVAYKRDDVLTTLKGIIAAVPDFSWTIEDLFTEEDRIAARLRDTGTPAGTWLGLEPTGAAVAFTEFASYRVRESRFAEMWFLMDYQSIAAQLQAGRRL